jgi:cadmium resistance protein CadD (predicted permease)
LIFLAGLAMFAATNIDGLFLTAALLAHRSFRARDVIIGTYAGIAALYAASAAGSLVSLVVPPAIIALLGLVPIALGIAQLSKKEASEPASFRKGGGVGAVAALNIATGADNIGVYTPVFAASSAADIALYGAIFAVLTGLWCYAAYRLVNHPSIGAPVRHYAPRLVPFVLIGLGLWILSGLA